MLKTASSPEARLIGAVICSPWSSGNAMLDPALFTNIDWTAIPGFAWQHKARPMLAAALRHAGWPGVPTEIQATIEAAESKCVAHGLQQWMLLQQLLTAARTAGIRVLVLKGIALSIHLYGNPLLRESFDLDLYVHPGQMSAFERLLRNTGCEFTGGREQLNPWQSGQLDQVHHHRQYRHPAAGVIIEVHWRLERNEALFVLDFEEMWAARQTVHWGGIAIDLPGPRDLLRHLHVHAARHTWSRWKWLGDLIALYRTTSETEWAAMTAALPDASERTWTNASLLLSCWVAQQTPLPAAYAAAMRDRKAVSLASNALRNGSSAVQENALTVRHGGLRDTRTRLALKRDLPYRLKELRLIFHSDADWYARPPGRISRWFYPVIRPVSLLIRMVTGRRSAKTS